MKKFENLVRVDLEIHKSANDNDWERYDAALPMVSLQLFKNNIGSWIGRETYIWESEDGYVTTNYWYVVESGIGLANEEIERIINNFELKSITQLLTSDAFDSEYDFKQELIETETLEWSWFRD